MMVVSFLVTKALVRKRSWRIPATVVMSIETLKQSDVPIRVWIVASISEVIYEWDWCYTSCLQCKRKMIEKDSRFYCANCKSHVLWNESSHKMIRELASGVVEKYVLENYPNGDVEIISKDVSKLAKPEPIQDLVGRSFLFKLSLEAKHISEG